MKSIQDIRERYRRLPSEEKKDMRTDIQSMLERFDTLSQQQADSWQPITLSAQEIGEVFRTRIVDMALLSLVMLEQERVREENEARYEEAVRTAAPKLKHVAVTNKPRIYTVTSIARNDSLGGTRTPVACDSFEKAREYVESNAMDLWENSYMLVVIEGNVPNHPYGMGLDAAGEEYWYRWNVEANKYEPIEKPKAYESVVCFGIG
jgi:hypothetical protein